MDSNVTEIIHLSTSTLVAIQITENADAMVDEVEEISSDDLTSTGDYSDYNILEKEKYTIAGKEDVLVISPIKRSRKTS